MYFLVYVKWHVSVFNYIVGAELVVERWPCLFLYPLSTGTISEIVNISSWHLNIMIIEWFILEGTLMVM